MSDIVQPPGDDAFFDGENPIFENHCQENGIATWSARDFAKFLGYKDYRTFFGSAINRAQQVCLSSKISVAENFRQDPTLDEEGNSIDDMRLSRFACYLCAMNGDPKKPAVAKAQAYFATFASSCRSFVEEAGQIERVLIRDEISDHEKTLCSEAKGAGVTEYAYFQNAGYRGLYNMNFSKLKELKGTPKGRSPLDFMGKDELAANLFRLTQTRAKIKNQAIHGQKALERTAEDVGRTVRKAMLEISGQRPELLATEGDIKKVKSALKNTDKGLQKIGDKKKKKPEN